MRRDDEDFLAHLCARHILTTQGGSRFLGDGVHQCAIQTVHTGIVKLRCDGTEHRHLIHLRFKQFMVPLKLLPHVAQRIQSTAFVKLIQSHHVGIIEHIDFLQLRGRAIFGRHYIQSHITVLGNHRITLTDSTRLYHNQIVPGHFQNTHGIVYM